MRPRTIGAICVGWLAVSAVPVALPADATADKPAAAACRDCGVVQDIRRIALTVRPRVDPLANPPAQIAGSQGTAPLLSIGREGVHRAESYPSKSAQHTVWEVTVRYDSGAYGVTRVEREPDLRIGDRVRLVEAATENQLQRLPPEQR